MTMLNRCRILASVSMLLVAACSTDAVDPVALSPAPISTASEATALVQADPESPLPELADLDLETLDENSLQLVTVAGLVQRLPLGNRADRLTGVWQVDDQQVVVRENTQLGGDALAEVGDAVRIRSRQIRQALVLATAIDTGLVGDQGDNTLLGQDQDDVINGRGGDDTIEGREGSDLISTGSGQDSLFYDAAQLGSDPDQLVDWEIERDRFWIDADAMGLDVLGSLSFVNALAADLPAQDVNVIVLQDADDDGNPDTVFNARSAARLIAQQITQARAGFFIYFNSALGVNRLVYASDLSNGEASIAVLAAINTLSGQAAIDALPRFTVENFAFVDNNAILGDNGSNTLSGTDFADEIQAFGGADSIDGRGGSDRISTGTEADTVIYNSSQLGSGPDQLSDWLTPEDRFLLDRADLEITAELSFINAFAADLPSQGVNVIVLQDADDDGDPTTVFNARSAARLIGAQIQTPAPGFFIYFNSALGVNRLVYTPDLSNGEASFSVLAAINTLTGEDAIAELPQFSATNFISN